MSKIEWVSLASLERWNSILSEFNTADIYYLPEYSMAFEHASEGVPYLVYYQNEQFQACNVVLLREISPESEDLFYDLTSQYGYGGWLFQGELSRTGLSEFYTAYEESCKSKHIISEVIRLHPKACLEESTKDFYEPKNIGSVIITDTSSEEIIWNNIISKNRNVIRKAEKMGVTIKYGGSELVPILTFKSVYDETMSRANAAEFYFFSNRFHEIFDDKLSKNFKYFAAYLDGQLLAVAIITHMNGMLNYHLSGTTSQAKGIPAMNLLLYRAAEWGAQNGYTSFNLGGGVGARHDSLYKFKKSFTKDDATDYIMLTKIYDDLVYDQLVAKQKLIHSEVDEMFFPLYRAPRKKEIEND